MTLADPQLSQSVPVHYQTMPQIVLVELRKAILEGTLQPGQRLRQDDIASSLGVSRIPVREALRQLEAEGFVVTVPHRGTVVAGLSAEDIEEIYLMRVALEGLAARLAAVKIGPRELTEMHELHLQIERASQSPDLQEFLRLDRSFHATHYSSALRPRLWQRISSLRDASERYICTYVALPGRIEKSLEHHRRLLEACERRDGDLAAKLVVEDLERTAAALISYIDRETRPRS